ncbi:MAG TPA: hypothetical protein PLQ97_09965 [Myxococcota bacterium]|nr:hypothetical protein [Myxococcota bacterium]HQK51204.1 hypothetical protein [Myxococcota bacterium]
MAGLFGGGVPAVIAGAMAATYRVLLGGIGVLPGLGTILTAALHRGGPGGRHRSPGERTPDP